MHNLYATTTNLPSNLKNSFVVAYGDTMIANSTITTSLNIVNYGTLNGIIKVNPLVEFSVRNDSVINAMFNLSGASTLKQYMSSSSEITKLNVTGGTYVPIICDNFIGNIDSSDLMNKFNGNILVNKSGLTIFTKMDELDGVLSMLDINGNVNASVILNITDYDGSSLTFDSHGGLVQIALNTDNDQMFNYNVTNGSILKVRETNYTAILGKNDKRAVFLNNLRVLDPSNKILKELDGATTEEELEVIMNKTMFFNPLVINDEIIGK